MSLERPYLLEVLCWGDFPDKTSPTAIRRNDEGVSGIARLGFKIRDCTESKSFNAHVFENNKSVVHRRSLGGATKAGSADEALIALWSMATGLPFGCSSFDMAEIIRYWE